MNKIINKYLLTGDKFKSELYLERLGFNFSACDLFAKHRGRIPTFRETNNLRQLFINELDKACFDHDAVYSDK